MEEELSYSFLASGNTFIWKRTIAHSLSNSMNHCPCYTWRQCQSSASVNPARYTLDNEDFIPSQLQTTPSPMHSDRMRALLYSSVPALLLRAFLPPEALDYFPQSTGTSFWLFFSGSVISTFSSATFTSSVDFIKLLFPPLSASLLLTCLRVQRVLLSSGPSVLNPLQRKDLSFPSGLFDLRSSRDPCAYRGRDRPKLDSFAPSLLLLLCTSVSVHVQFCQAALSLPASVL